VYLWRWPRSSGVGHVAVNVAVEVAVQPWNWPWCVNVTVPVLTSFWRQYVNDVGDVVNLTS
jgi:hypothetical protein